MKRKYSGFIVATVIISVASQVNAQWLTQQIDLTTGWNAVHLYVQPANDSCSEIFADKPVSVVSWWCRDVSLLGVMPPAPDMRNWYAADPAASTFYRMLGGECYLIKANSPATIMVRGTPALPSSSLWLGKPNLVGMSVPLPDNVQLNEYFGFFNGLTNSPMPYATVMSSGATVVRPGSYKPRPGQALWVSTAGNGTAEYAGPFNISIDSPGTVMTFTDNTPRTLRIRNNAGVERTVHINHQDSATPPYGQGGLAGSVPLMVALTDWSLGYPRESYQELSFPLTTNIAANTTLELKLMPDLAAMPLTQDAYQSILTISDQGSADNHSALTQGRMLYRVGVRAEGNLAAKAQSTGLWVGQAVLDKVNRAKMLGTADSDWSADLLQDAPQPFGFRIIVHVDQYGGHRLLKEIFIATEQGVNTLLATREQAKSFRITHPGAQIRRISTANFHFFGDPCTMQPEGGGFAAAEGTLSGTFLQSYTNQVNPFVHAFHSDHDNREVINSQTYIKDKPGDDGSSGSGDYEAWSIQREVKLTFAGTDPLGANPEWNIGVTGGIYEERVLGLNEPGNPILTSGAFRLVKIADTPTIHYLSAP